MYKGIDTQLTKLQNKVGKAIAEVDQIQELWKGVSQRISNMEAHAKSSSSVLNEAGKEPLFQGLTDMFEEWTHLKEIFPEFCKIFACYSIEEIREQELRKDEQFSQDVAKNLNAKLRAVWK